MQLGQICNHAFKRISKMGNLSIVYLLPVATALFSPQTLGCKVEIDRRG